MQKKTAKKPNLSPEAAKILEQYRSAGKTQNGNNGGVDNSDEDAGTRASTPPPPKPLHRSGTRGK